MEEMNKLLRGKAWVVFTFKDGTKVTILSSLNKELLNSDGIALAEGKLWDYNRGSYVPFREDAVSVDVLDEKPVFESEVLEFASRFI